MDEGEPASDDCDGHEGLASTEFPLDIRVGVVGAELAPLAPLPLGDVGVVEATCCFRISKHCRNASAESLGNMLAISLM